MARILLAEDDASLRNFLARALERAGHDVVTVENGSDAYDRLAGGEFELLIADIVMPGLDGIELARRAGTENPALRIVLITGFAAMALQARDADIGRTRVLSKPVHLRELVDQVDEVLAT